MDAKCLHSIKVIMKDGTQRSFERGTIYDVSDLPEQTVRAHFESPEVAPSKKSTRAPKGGE